MAALNKYQRKERERWYQQKNHLSNSICEGAFYIWNRGEKEFCSKKDSCPKHSLYIENLENRTIFDQPWVQFYYVENFRKCNLNTRKPESDGNQRI